jgi:hypothetical protein
MATARARASFILRDCDRAAEYTLRTGAFAAAAGLDVARRALVAASVGAAPIVPKLKSAALAIQNNDFLFKTGLPLATRV